MHALPSRAGSSSSPPHRDFVETVPATSAEAFDLASALFYESSLISAVSGTHPFSPPPFPVLPDERSNFFADRVVSFGGGILIVHAAIATAPVDCACLHHSLAEDHPITKKTG